MVPRGLWHFWYFWMGYGMWLFQHYISEMWILNDTFQPVSIDLPVQLWIVGFICRFLLSWAIVSPASLHLVSYPVSSTILQFSVRSFDWCGNILEFLNPYVYHRLLSIITRWCVWDRVPAMWYMGSFPSAYLSSLKCIDVRAVLCWFVDSPFFPLIYFMWELHHVLSDLLDVYTLMVSWIDILSASATIVLECFTPNFWMNGEKFAP